MKKAIECYLVGLLILVLYFSLDFIFKINQPEFSRIILLVLSCILFYVGATRVFKETNSNKALKINLVIMFLIYLILLITLTLFDPLWGRHGLDKVIDTSSFKYYIDHALNLVPFKTISIYIKNMYLDILTTENVMYNLVGNFICMMPLSIFLPLLFKCENNIKTFIKTIILIPIMIELIQFITTSGSCDIDDVILNSSGAIILYLLISIKRVKRLLFKILIREEI